MHPMEQQRRAAAAAAVRAAFPPEVTEAVIGANEEGDAFGAVAWHLQHAVDAGQSAEDVLSDLDPDDVAWSVNAQNPAAFIASRLAC